MKKNTLFISFLLMPAALSMAQITIPLSSLNIKEGKLIVGNVTNALIIKATDSETNQFKIYGQEVFLDDATATELSDGGRSITLNNLRNGTRNISFKTLNPEDLNLSVNALEGIIKVEEKAKDSSKRKMSSKKGVRIVTYHIEIPKWFSVSVKLKSPNSELQIEGVEGEVDVENQNAVTTLKNIYGPIVATSDYGRIDVQNLDKRCQSPISITTGTSDIQVFVPEEINADVKMMASAMNVDPDITWTMDNETGQPGNWFRATLNSGGVPIHIQTGTGEVTFRLR